MSHHKKHRDSVPPENQPQAGPGGQLPTDSKGNKPAKGDAGFAQQDPKRRLGDYATEGEHPFQQPGGKNDANR